MKIWLSLTLSSGCHSILDRLVKNLSDNDYKNLSQEFNGDLLELVKQK